MSQFPSITNANGLWTAKKVKRGVQGSNWPLAPAAPTIGTATAGIASASITFTAPSYVGSSAITGYLATANPGGLTGTSATSPVTISGLSWTTSYTFNVSAINSQAVGPVSAQSNSVTPNPYPPFAGLTVFGSTSGVTTGTFSVGSATSLVIYGCAGGGAGSAWVTPTYGTGGGGGGASQLTGYTISVTPGENLSYSVGGPGGNTTISRSGTVIFELLAGGNGDPANRWGGTGGALNSYASHAGGDGGSGSGRFDPGAPGTSVTGCAGGGAGGSVGDSSPLTAGGAGGAGGTSSTTGSIFTGTTGGAGGAHTVAGTNKLYAYAGGASTNFYNGGGGGAGGGITMTGAGGYYYGGGGGGNGDNFSRVNNGGPGLLHIPA